MGLSYDLISEFVKITNDKKENTKEGTVYATVVSGTGGKYVRIDGSDLLTPMDTTTDIEDGERVTLMIKDHKAIVTGNVTTPSASTSKVDKVTESVNSVSDRVGTFELVVADKVSTNELEAYKATIEVLIANKATIEDLTATNAKIENLEAKNAEIENLVAGKATIEDLKAVNATIENLKAKDAEIENAVVENLKATTADIKILNADFAQIKTLVNGNLTSDNILSFNLTSEKVTVDDAFIKDAMIDTISAGKINAGKINTNSVSIGSEDGGMLITGSTQQFTDKNGNVRIQIGKDASGDFTFILYGENGQGQIINQNGITASAISNGLIVNNMVSDNAAISGGKLDISSVITEINGDNSTTINSSKIYLNDQAQSLEVAFNSLKTKVDTFQEVTIQGELTAIVEQVQSNTSKIEANKNSINTLISEDTVIKKQVTDLQGTLSETETTLNSKYTTLSQNLDGFKTTVADTYATKKSVTDVVDNIETNYSTTSVMNSAIEQKAQEISASVSSTYATKNEVSTLDNNLKTNYSTTQQMESAINIAKEEINLGVSSIYETKENSTSKINNINIGSVNRLTGTNKPFMMNMNNPTDYRFWDAYFTPNKQTLSELGFKIGDQVTVGFKWEISKNGTNDFVYGDFRTEFVGSDGLFKGVIKQPVATFSSSNTKGRSEATVTLNETNLSAIGLRIRIDNSVLTLRISDVKMEKGNKATSWSPAPEDVTNDISTAKTDAIQSANDTLTTTIANYYTKSQTDSQINVAKEAINLGVSTTYETKENVETKVTSTLDSAKSYADTKKSEAISTAADDATSKANTAKQEAIKSADNTLTSTIANYYTKTQTDSQINIAKNAINLSVSETYETKTNVESKVSTTLDSAKSYADTKKSEAISTAASDASSKANKAKTDAINEAASDATSKANTAKNDAISAAAADATSKVNKINVGSVNLLAGTGTPYSCDIDKASGFATRDPYFTPNKQTLSELGFKVGDQLTLGLNWEISKNGSNNFVYGDFRAEFVGADGNYKGVIKNPVATFSASNTKGRSEATVTLNETNLLAVGLRIRVDNSVLTLNISNVKMEKGNKATSWSPAPEDIESDITSIESETKSLKSTVSSLQLGADSISASVKSLEESMTNTTNGLASDISRIQDQVNLKMTSNDVKLEIQKEMSKGTNKVTTSTGFTFDQNGLNISKTDSEMKTQITEDGMKIYKNSDVMLTANNQGVDAKNLHATTYLIIGNNSRMEDFTENGSKRTAVFWIG